MDPTLTDVLMRECGLHYADAPVATGIVHAAIADSDLAGLLTAVGPPALGMQAFVAAVHATSLETPQAPLAAFLPTLGGGRLVAEPAFAGALRDTVLERRPQIEAAITRRRCLVKTEIRRTAILRLLVCEGWRMMGSPAEWIHVDLGSSVGCNLLLDRVAVTVDRSLLRMDVRNGVGLDIPLTGDLPPSPGLPLARRRTGIDLYRLDAADPADRLWLLGSVNPEDVAGIRVLGAALDALAADPPEFVQSDAVDGLDSVLATIEPGLPVIVTHSMMLHYLTADRRAMLSSLLAREASRRPVVHASMEMAGPATLLRVAVGEGQRERIMGRAGFNGQWLAWQPRPV